MSYDAKTERLIALKKLAGKAQTSNDKGLSNEALPSGITSTSETIFGESISTIPSSAALYAITGKAEYVRFPTSFIAGSDTSDGRHGFELKLPSDYEGNSSNTKAGTYPFTNNQIINITSGSLQLIPTSFATAYEAKPYYGGTATKDSGTQIPLLDARDWYMDYFNGVFFQQDPSGTGDQADNPDYVEGFLYIGDMLDAVVSNAGGGDASAQYLVLAATSSLSAERVLTTSTGISSSDGGAGGSFTLTVDDRIVATLTGSQFSGNIGVTGSIGATSFFTGSMFKGPVLSGSLTRLHSGTSFIIAGTGVTVSSGSAGAITITNSKPSGVRDKIVYEVTSSHASGSPLTLTSADFSIGKYDPDLIDLYLNGTLLMSGSGNDYALSPSVNNKVTFNFLLESEDLVTAVIEESGGASTSSSTSPGGSSTQVQFNDGGVFGGDSGFLYNKTSNDLYVEGVLTGSMGLSGSLTRLIDGTSYLIGGNNVTIVSASNGSVTVSSSGASGTGDYQSKTTDFTVSSTEYMIGINTSSGAVTGTLEAAATAGTGRQLIFKDVGGYAGNTSKGILIKPNGSEKIDGGTSVAILVNSGSVSILSDGSAWLVFGVS
jgi:hypothetical protein